MIGFLFDIISGLILIGVLLETRALRRKSRTLEKQMVTQDTKMKEFEKLAVLDPLTGLLNLRGGNQIIEHYHAVLSRSKNPLHNFAILNFDLNRFKKINDQFGHYVGDQALKHFGAILTKNLRRHGYDIVMRNGGDEFLVFLSECDLLKAKAVKTKIKKALKGEPLITADLKLHLETSVGISMAFVTGGEVLPLEKIYKIADDEMFHDKEITSKKLAIKERRR